MDLHRDPTDDRDEGGGITPSTFDTGLGGTIRHIVGALRQSRNEPESGLVSSEGGTGSSAEGTSSTGSPPSISDILAAVDRQQIENKESKIMLVNNREKTHGNYRDNATMSQGIKDLMRGGKNWNALNDMQRESLEMIAVKLGRILTGDAGFRDHWDDIGGYAQLASSNASPSMPQVKVDLTQALNQ